MKLQIRRNLLPKAPSARVCHFFLCVYGTFGRPHTVLPIGPKLVPGVATLPYGIFFLQACGSDAELLSTTRSPAKPIQPILAAPCRPCSSSMSSADRHNHVCSKTKCASENKEDRSHIHDKIISKYLALAAFLRRSFIQIQCQMV